MRSGFRPQSELRPALMGLSSVLRLGYPLCRPLYHVCSPGHKGRADLASSSPSSGLSPAVSCESVTQDEGCARYPT